MTDFIYQIKNSIPDTLCDEIIAIYDEDNTKYDGTTISGVNKSIKDTTDLLIPKDDIKWNKIENFLYKELSNKLLKYTANIYKKNYENDNYDKKFDFFQKKNLMVHYFMVQKYNKNKGKYVYHDDSYNTHNSQRVITFLWYLNTVEEGGETVFWDNYKIKPEKGKLLLFPSTWTYPHTGKMPISHDKYIITGWLCIDKQY